MRSKTIRFGAISLLCTCLILAVVFLVFHEQEENAYSCYYIPVGDGNLSWGMSKEEITAVMGEPASVENREYGDALTYDTLISSKLGSCSKLILYVGYDEPTDVGQQTVPGGLSIIDMTVDETTKEVTIERLSAIYGELTEGSTQMELDLQEGIANYFNKYYYCDEWKIGTLPQEEYNQLIQFYQESTDGRPIDEKKELMYMRVSGVAEGDVYTCNVRLDAYVLSCLESVKN